MTEQHVTPATDEQIECWIDAQSTVNDIVSMRCWTTVAVTPEFAAWYSTRVSREVR